MFLLIVGIVLYSERTIQEAISHVYRTHCRNNNAYQYVKTRENLDKNVKNVQITCKKADIVFFYS